MLKVSNLKKRFGNTEVLKGVNLHIKKGEILVVVGNSVAERQLYLDV